MSNYSQTAFDLSLELFFISSSNQKSIKSYSLLREKKLQFGAKLIEFPGLEFDIYLRKTASRMLLPTDYFVKL